MGEEYEEILAKQRYKWSKKSKIKMLLFSHQMKKNSIVNTQNQ